MTFFKKKNKLVAGFFLMRHNSAMQDETNRERSPKAPRINIDEALKYAKALHANIGRSTVKPEAAISAMGYKGTSGASLSTMAALNMYGLIDRKQGAVNISQLCMRLLFPTDENMRKSALRDAVLTPAQFGDIHARFHECSEDALATNLIHEGFSPESAKNIASVYKENSAIADLQKKEYNDQSLKVPPVGETGVGARHDEQSKTPKLDPPNPPKPQTVEGKVLATYSIPLGANEATLTFTGEVLTTEDFDALGEFVEFAKKQFERKSKNRSEYPKAAIWKNGDFDKPVTIIGQMGVKNGVTYFQSSDGTGIPEAELRFAN